VLQQRKPNRLTYPYHLALFFLKMVCKRI